MDGLRKKIESKIETVTKLAFENEQLNVTYQALSEQYSPKNIQVSMQTHCISDMCELLLFVGTPQASGRFD